MPSSPSLTVLAAKLQALAYDDTFLAVGILDLSAFSRTFRATLWANDPGIGRVRHGHISVGAEGPIWSIAGTLMPKGSIVEWLDNLDSFLEPSPWHLGDKVHRGFLTFNLSLSVEMDGEETPLGAFIEKHPELCNGAVVQGHSLGGPNAIFAFMEMHACGWVPAGVILWACPRPGDGPFRASVIEAIQTANAFLESYANPNDAVPNLPFTVTRPFNIWDFEAVVRPLDLSPALVTPPIADDWLSSHRMANYAQLIEAYCRAT